MQEQGQAPQPGAAPPPPPPAAVPPSNGVAIAALIFGLVGLFFWCLSIVPVILGIIGLSKAKQHPSRPGYGMAMAGLILGIVELVLLVVVVAAIAIPNILAGKMAANEAGTIANLRTISSAEELYSVRNGEYGTMAELEAAGNIDSVLAQATSPERAKSGYYFTMTAEGYDYQCIAKPQKWGVTGTRIFKIDQSGTVYEARVENPGEDDWGTLGDYR